MQDSATDQAKLLQPRGTGSGLIGSHVGNISQTKQNLKQSDDHSRHTTDDTGDITPEDFCQLDVLATNVQVTNMNRKCFDVAGIGCFLVQPNNAATFLQRFRLECDRASEGTDGSSRFRVSNTVNDKDQLIDRLSRFAHLCCDGCRPTRLPGSSRITVALHPLTR